MQITITSLWSKLHPASHNANLTYIVELDAEYDQMLPGENRTDWIHRALEAAYALTNRDGRPFARAVCSTSTGDIMVLDGQAYFVEGIGLAALSPAQAAAAARLSVLETYRGYTWLREHNLIP
jgi:hypothetical protein